MNNIDKKCKHTVEFKFENDMWVLQNCALCGNELIDLVNSDIIDKKYNPIKTKSNYDGYLFNEYLDSIDKRLKLIETIVSLKKENKELKEELAVKNKEIKAKVNDIYNKGYDDGSKEERWNGGNKW